MREYRVCIACTLDINPTLGIKNCRDIVITLRLKIRIDFLFQKDCVTDVKIFTRDFLWQFSEFRDKNCLLRSAIQFYMER